MPRADALQCAYFLTTRRSSSAVVISQAWPGRSPSAPSTSRSPSSDHCPLDSEWERGSFSAGEDVIEVEQLTDLDDANVLMEGRQYGLGRRSGIRIADRLHIVFHFTDDRVTRMYWHPDREEALKAAGLLD